MSTEHAEEAGKGADMIYIEETYRQRFRAPAKKEDEVVSELAVRLNDLLQKWTKICTSADEVRDRVVQEQLLSSLPTEGRITQRA